jgi:quinol monooxygenase YgiN
VNAGMLGTVSGHRDELVATLTQRNDLLRELGCSVYEVGINADAPDTVFVVEVWDSQEAHRRSFEHLEVQASIAAARPILAGEFGGFRFDVVGSPFATRNQVADSPSVRLPIGLPRLRWGVLA